MSEKQKINPKSRDYKFEFKLYPDCTEYDCEDVLTKLKSLFTEYVIVLHDKDERRYSTKCVPLIRDKYRRHLWVCATGTFKRGVKGHRKKAHYHFYGLNNHNKLYSIKSIVEYLQVPFKYSQNGDFRFVGNWHRAMLYAIHKNAPEKYQYPLSAVTTNIVDWYKKYFLDKKPANEQLDLIMSMIEDWQLKYLKPPTYFQLVRVCNELHLTLHLAKPSLVKDLLYSYKYPDKI